MLDCNITSIGCDHTFFSRKGMLKGDDVDGNGQKLHVESLKKE